MGDCCCSPFTPTNVIGPGAPTVAGDVVIWASTDGRTLADSGIASADLVLNPAASVAGNLAIFNDTSGNQIRDAGTSVAGLARLTIVTEPNATRTLTAADAGCYIRFTNAAGCVVTVNNGVFTAGDPVVMRQVGVGAISFAGTATLTPPTTNTAVSGQQGATIALMFTTANAADVMGDLADV